MLIFYLGHFHCLSIVSYISVMIIKSYQQVDEKNWHYDQKDDPQEVRDDGEQDFLSILTLSTGRLTENCIKAEVPRCH